MKPLISLPGPQRHLLNTLGAARSACCKVKSTRATTLSIRQPQNLPQSPFFRRGQRQPDPRIPGDGHQQTEQHTNQIDRHPMRTRGAAVLGEFSSGPMCRG
jgi:hypothetical protein